MGKLNLAAMVGKLNLAAFGEVGRRAGATQTKDTHAAPTGTGSRWTPKGNPPRVKDIRTEIHGASGVGNADSGARERGPLRSDIERRSEVEAFPRHSAATPPTAARAEEAAQANRAVLPGAG